MNFTCDFVIRRLIYEISRDKKLISCNSACVLRLKISVFETETPRILIPEVFSVPCNSKLELRLLVRNFLVSVLVCGFMVWIRLFYDLLSKMLSKLQTHHWYHWFTSKYFFNISLIELVYPSDHPHFNHILQRFIFFFCLSLSVFSLKLKMNCDKCNRFRLGRCEFDSETLI